MMASRRSTVEAKPRIMMMKHMEKGHQTDYYKAKKSDSWLVP
jgi:hypothetical protein